MSLVKEIHINNREELNNLSEELVNITINDIPVGEDLINRLNKLPRLENIFFNKCIFKDKPLLTNIKGLHFSECKLGDVNFLGDLNNLTSLSLEYMDVNNLEFINKLNNLKEISFTGSVLPKRIELSKTTIQVLHIDGVIISSTDNIFFPEGLKTLYISKIQYLLNPEYFNELKKYGVKVEYGLDTELVD